MGASGGPAGAGAELTALARDLADARAEAERLRAQADAARRGTDALLDALRQRYALPDGDAEQLSRAVLSDERWIEQRAEEEGLSVAQAREREEMRAEIAQLKRDNARVMEAQRRADEQEIQQRMARDLEALHELDPSITDLHSVLSRADYPQLRARLAPGMGLADAYRSLYFDQLMERARAEAVSAGRQAQRNAERSKEHLTAHGRAGAQVRQDVPPEVRDLYRSFGLEVSDEEMTRHYNRYLKSKE